MYKFDPRDSRTFFQGGLTSCLKWGGHCWRDSSLFRKIGGGGGWLKLPNQPLPGPGVPWLDHYTTDLQCTKQRKLTSAQAQSHDCITYLNSWNGNPIALWLVKWVGTQMTFYAAGNTSFSGGSCELKKTIHMNTETWWCND